MSIGNKIPLRAAAFVVAALALLAVSASAGTEGPVEASHGGMDVMSLDAETAGNTSSTADTTPEKCARIQNDGSMAGPLNADEDFVDGIYIDVIAGNIPAHNNGGTPSSGGDDSGGIVSYAYTLKYPAQFTVQAQEATNSAVNILFRNNSNPSGDVNNPSQALPDDETSNYNEWSSSVLDMRDVTATAPESGDGVLDRLSVSVDDLPAPPANGQYLIELTDNFHVDAANAELRPHTTGLANIAVNQACGTLTTSLGYYHPVNPARILNTRSSPQGNPPGPADGGEIITVDVTGVGGVPASGVTAVVVNTTADTPSAASHITVYPSGTGLPVASNLNFVGGQTVPNLVTVKVGADGNVNLRNNSGTTHVIFDVVGYYGVPASGSRYNPLTPARILNTRNNTGGTFGPNGVGPGQTITVQATGVGGVPAVGAGVTAVVINTTADTPSAASHLTVYPQGTGLPGTSNLNFVAGQTVANLVAVKVNATNGQVNVRNNSGSTHVIFDVVGWYGTSNGDVFNPLPPYRILDTRHGTGGFSGKIGPGAPNGQTIAVQARGAAGSGVPAVGPTAVIVNTTVTDPTAPSHLTVYPSDAGLPEASNLNFIANRTVPNLVAVRVGAADGKVKVFNNSGQTHVIFDVVGYFAPVPPP